jgi:acetyltransferase-like isoleucine patch superfamily enzyme
MVRLPGGRRRLDEELLRSLGYAFAPAPGVVIETEYLHLGTDVRIAADVRIETDCLALGDMTTIGAESRIATGTLMLGDGASLGEGVRVDVAGGRHADSQLLVGPASVVGSWVHANTCRSVIIDAEAAVSPGSMIFTHSFWQSALDGYSASFRPVRLERNAWVGAGCQVMPGVRVGDGAVIMANSTVVGDVPETTLVGGVPAIVLRRGLRRPLDPVRRLRRVSQIVRQLVDDLLARGCAATQASDGAYRLELPDGTKGSILLSEAGESPPADGEVLITLARWDGAAGQGIVFDLESLRVIGEESRLGYEVRNRLRRYGIRFQPYGWRSDFRKGI